MEVPRKAIVTTTLVPGATYLLEIDNIPSEHFFVVLNYDPATDEAIILVNATTQHVGEAYHIVRTKLPYDTLVYIPQGQSKVLPKASTFNTNVYQAFTIAEMESNPKIKRLVYKGVIEPAILEQLRTGFVASPRVLKKHKLIISSAGDSK